MEKYLLDTNVIIALLRGKDLTIADKIRRVGISNCYISDVTLYELYCGAMYSTRAERSSAQIDILASQIQILSLGEYVKVAARQKALLRSKGMILEDFDIMIASAALSRQLTLVTGNLKHMGRIEGLTVKSVEEI